MNFRPAAWLCLIGAAACSHNNPEPTNTANDVYQPNVARAEPELTPASLEARPAPEASTPTTPATTTSSSADANDVRAPLLAEPQRSGANDAKREPAPSNAPTPPAGTQPDNTKVNQRDTGSAALTPLDQRENETDLKITQHVRQAVMADGSLSFTAKNVKIITQGGKVTLRGPVKTAQERDAIDAAARKVAGVTQVDNQIEVKK